MGSGNQTSSLKSLDLAGGDIEISASYPPITEQDTQTPLEKKPRLSGQYTKGENPTDQEESPDIELLENVDYVITCDSDYDEDDPVFELSCIVPSDGFYKYEDFLQFVIKQQELKGYCYKNPQLLKVVIVNAGFWVVSLKFEADLDGVSMTCRAGGMPACKYRDHTLYSFSSERTPNYTEEEKVFAKQALWINASKEAFDALGFKFGERMSGKSMLKILAYPEFYTRADDA